METEGRADGGGSGATNRVESPEKAQEGRETSHDAASEGIARVGETLSAARSAIGRAGHALGQGGVARSRRLRRQAKAPLPLLYEVHPEARRALPHPLGLRTVQLTEIAGTAVEPAQRGGDFLPLPGVRTVNWQGRWQRLRRAHGRLAPLPPIDVVRFADRYWVVDGHNRVALALYEDQVAVDADVTDLRLPGEASEPEDRHELAPLLAASRELRAGGLGAIVRTADGESETIGAEEDAEAPS